MVITRKIKLIPQSLRKKETDDIKNKTIKEIKFACYAQSVIMNTYMSMKYSSLKIKDIPEISEIIDDNFIREITNSCIRVPKTDDGILENLYVPFGGYQTSAIAQRVKSAFTKSMEDGLMNGRVALPTFKEDAPFYISKQFLRLEHEYSNYEEFLKALYTRNKSLKLFLNYGSYGNPTLARFQVILGSVKKSRELRNVIERIFTEEYKICGSSIGIKDNKDIILHLSIDIPETKRDLDQDIIVGVDMGIKIPAVCALNNNDFIKEYIGYGPDFQKQRDSYYMRRKSLQKGLRMTSGGHGREKKLKALDKIGHREKNWARTYNHKLSKLVVDFAIEHHAGTIQLEDLSNIKRKSLKKNKILADWTYYQLQEQIRYKAQKQGIKVVKINPHNTSITCSCCGNVDEEQRKNQEDFICNNPECKNYNQVINADFNAARNISMSTDYVDKTKKKTKKRN